ncbi:MAG: type I restriction endonuclease subunit R [Myxococcota bacterium]
MPRGYNEDELVQATVADYFRDSLGWRVVYAWDAERRDRSLLGRSEDAEVVLIPALKAALRRLNPGAPEDAVAAAVAQLTAPSTGRSLVQVNRDLWKLVRDGVPVEARTPAGYKPMRLRVLDFDDTPGANDFLLVRELCVQGPVSARRADMVGFVNGLPLLFVECKGPHRDLRLAYDNNYLDYRGPLDGIVPGTIPQLFQHNAVVVLTNGKRAVYGSLTSDYKAFATWKRAREADEPREDVPTFLDGVCSRKGLLDLFENFTVFDEKKGRVRKVVGRNHQVLGVNAAVENVRRRVALEGRLGTFWHTQGSGKSYSMVFFAEKVHRRIGGFTFLVVTDRQELDNQIVETFAGVGVIDPKEAHAPSIAGLRERLTTGNRRYVFTLIQKFQDAGTLPWNESGDVIVMSDEAHRTQYGRFAETMRRVLPRASFIGFTGTPLMTSDADQLTARIFGPHVSTYNFQQAVVDAATVPLQYDNRGEKLKLVTPDLDDAILDVIERHDLDSNQRAKLDRELGRDYPVLTAPERLDTIAADLVAHVVRRWEAALAGEDERRPPEKAMLVCIDKLTCVRMYDRIEREWDAAVAKVEARCGAATDPAELRRLERLREWMYETERRVVVSEAQNELEDFAREGLDIAPHRKEMKGRDLEKEFKDPEHPFRLVIVCAMWLTGFDVPSLSTLYIDKPMKGHTLMQAIARVNRVWDDSKDAGYLIDYNVLLKALREALARYAAGGGGEPPKPEDWEAAARALREAVAEEVAHLAACGFEIARLIAARGFERLRLLDGDVEGSAVNAVCRDARSRAQFEVLAREVFRRRRALLDHPELIEPVRDEADAIDAIYKQLQENRESADISAVLREIQGVVSASIAHAERRRVPGADSGKLYDISTIDFEKLKREFAKSPRKQAQLLTLADAVQKQIDRMIHENPTRGEWTKRFEEILAAYNRETDRVTIEKTFEELVKFVGGLADEDQRHVREGLEPDQLAVFDLIVRTKGELDARSRERVKLAAASVLDAVKAEIARIDRWREKEDTRDRVRGIIRDRLWDAAQGLPEAFDGDAIEAAAEAVFQHVFERWAA